jgi:AbiV family abortive infection protein
VLVTLRHLYHSLKYLVLVTHTQSFQLQCMTEIEKFINEFDDELIRLTLEKGKLIFPNKNTRTADFNRACDHVERLLNDSYILYNHESYGSSVFLAITAIEEVAKIHFGLYRNNEGAENVPGHQDSLFNHREKHRLGLLPTVLMGSRLLEAVDETSLLQVLDKTKQGKLVALRESSIYAENRDSKFKIPEQFHQYCPGLPALLMHMRDIQ